MSVKLTPVAVVSFREWLRRRAEKKALLKAMDELSHSRDDELNDIGVSRDDIVHSFRSRPTLFRWFTP